MENYLEITGDTSSRRQVFIPQGIDEPYDTTLVMDDGHMDNLSASSV